MQKILMADSGRPSAIRGTRAFVECSGSVNAFRHSGLQCALATSIDCFSNLTIDRDRDAFCFDVRNDKQTDQRMSEWSDEEHDSDGGSLPQMPSAAASSSITPKSSAAPPPFAF